MIKVEATLRELIVFPPMHALVEPTFLTVKNYAIKPQIYAPVRVIYKSLYFISEASDQILRHVNY